MEDANFTAWDERFSKNTDYLRLEVSVWLQVK